MSFQSLRANQIFERTLSQFISKTLNSQISLTFTFLEGKRKVTMFQTLSYVIIVFNVNVPWGCNKTIVKKSRILKLSLITAKKRKKKKQNQKKKKKNQNKKQWNTKHTLKPVLSRSGRVS